MIYNKKNLKKDIFINNLEGDLMKPIVIAYVNVVEVGTKDTSILLKMDLYKL